jgi:hypothetical protein
MYIPVLTEVMVIKGAHIVAAKWALLHNNPALTAAQTGARMANVIPGAVNPAYVPVLTHGATAAALSHGTVPAVLSQGTAGAAAAPTASASAVHDAVKLVIPVVAWAAWQLLRKPEPSGEGKGVLPAR